MFKRSSLTLAELDRRSFVRQTILTMSRFDFRLGRIVL